jgi:hypothetical protein
MQVAEHAERDAPDRALRDAHEDHVAQLLEERGREAQDAVDREQRHRHRDQGRGRIEPVDHLLHHQRHADVGELGDDEEGERDHHAPLVFPQVRDQRPDRTPFAALHPPIIAVEHLTNATRASYIQTFV